MSDGLVLRELTNENTRADIVGMCFLGWGYYFNYHETNVRICGIIK